MSTDFTETHLPFPNQLLRQVTTLGQPVVCTSPLMICGRGQEGGLTEGRTCPRSSSGDHRSLPFSVLWKFGSTAGTRPQREGPSPVRYEPRGPKFCFKPHIQLQV